MLKNYLPVSRTQYEALQTTHKAAVADLQTSCAALTAERDQAFQSVEDAIVMASVARAIASRALILLAEVNAARTGGKPWDEKRTALFTDAKEAGLWDER